MVGAPQFEGRRFRLYCLLVLLVCPLASQAQGVSHYAGTSPREFVERFYKWYVPLALNDQISRSWEVAVKIAPQRFSPELIKLLREDAAAQAECKELVGLDFDPFLYTQEPAQVYVVGKITRVGEDYQAKIYSVDHGLRSREPSLTAAFRRKADHWFFVNFYYSSPKDDLLTVLKSRPPCSEPRVPAGK